jgi:hypothetical protein
MRSEHYFGILYVAGTGFLVSAMVAVQLWTKYLHLRRLLPIESPPTSRMIGVNGRIVAGGEVVTAPLSGAAVVWYRASLLRPPTEGHAARVPMAAEERSVPFELDDGSGTTVLVRLEGASVEPPREPREWPAPPNPATRMHAVFERLRPGSRSIPEHAFLREEILAPDDVVIVHGAPEHGHAMGEYRSSPWSVVVGATGDPEHPMRVHGGRGAQELATAARSAHIATLVAGALATLIGVVIAFAIA